MLRWRAMDAPAPGFRPLYAQVKDLLVQRLVEFFRARGTEDVSEFEVVQEDVRFMLPKEIRRELAARA
jgi:4-hydroxy-3-methylbut-2-en-1-yl diphosphate reductase